jgi:hypothetical protein
MSPNSVNNTSLETSNFINSYGIIHDEWAETSYMGMNILLNILSSKNLEICAQSSAKINTILHNNKHLLNVEEACYLIAGVESVMQQTLKIDNEYENNDEYGDQFYAFLIPIMKSLVEKSYDILQMNFKVPNIPLFSAISPSFYEDFKSYCKTDEWRVFIDKHVHPMRDQYMAMCIAPFQMNMKIWLNTCHESLMVSIHKRNRIMGESKIKFEDTIYNQWKERDKQEFNRYQMHLIQLKRNNLNMRKYLHTVLRFFTSEMGTWNEVTSSSGQKKKEIYWMLSSNENRERMRCKLIENLKFDSHFEASRLRDYSGYNDQYAASASTLKMLSNDETSEQAESESSSDQQSRLTQKLHINKEAINNQIGEDFIGDEEFMSLQQQQHPSQNSPPTNQSEQNNTNKAASSLSSDSGIVSGQSTNSDLSRRTSVSSTNTTQTITSSTTSIKPTNLPPEQIEAFNQLEEKEKLILKCDCELITITKAVKGRFELTNKYIYFFDLSSTFYTSFDDQILVNDSSENLIINNYAQHQNNNNNLNDNKLSVCGDPATNNQQELACASYVGFDCSDFDVLNDFKISLAQLREVQLRRYNLRRSALEFFLINEHNFFINFNKSVINFISIVKKTNQIKSSKKDSIFILR